MRVLMFLFFVGGVVYYCSIGSQAPVSIFNMNVVDTVKIDFPAMPISGSAAVDICMDGAKEGDFFVVMPVFPDTLPQSDAISLDICCDVQYRGFLTITAVNCMPCAINPPAAEFIIKKSVR